MLSRRSIAILHDLFMAAASFWLSLALRLGDSLPQTIPAGTLLIGCGLFTVTAAVMFHLLGMYRGIWRYASMRDLIAITRAVTMTVLVFTLLMFLLTRLDDLPRSLPLINWLVLAALLGGPRFLYRMWKDGGRRISDLSGPPRIPVLLAGTNDAADLFIRAMERGDGEYSVVGMLTERQDRIGMQIHGVPVLGHFDQLGAVLAQLKARHAAPRRLVLCRDDVGASSVRSLFEQAQTLGLPMARLPRMSDLREGLSDRLSLRPIAIEDLLGRPQVTLNREAVRTLITGKRVLITGAGGSIGSEIVRQVADLSPARLTLADSSEFALYTIDLELSERWPQVSRDAKILDVRDAERIEAVFDALKPELVLHAAALKHVPLVEANPLEGIRTNTLGTALIADACRRHGVGLMVMISTDKAVNPTNVMGTTKRLAELYCQSRDLEGRAEGSTRFVTVRFGNVLGSTGSVVPLFRRQLERGGPLTVTHPDMTRYFMTIREAVELVLEAAAIGRQDDSFGGKIVVLDMGEPVKIVDLARQMIRLAGLRPDEDVKITFTGPRPGEKLFEEIFHGAEPPQPTEHAGLLIATPRRADPAVLAEQFARLKTACTSGDTAMMRDVFRVLVPEYVETPHG